jgi:KDO2-lipid IV(A) lauroyltransferase
MSEGSLKQRWRHLTKVVIPGNGLLLSHYLMGLLPIDVVSAIGSRLGIRFGAKNRTRDARVRHNLAVLRPDIRDPAEFEATVRRFWGNSGRSMAEFSVLRRIWRSDRMSVIGMEHLDRARASGRPRICMFLHLGNWELVGPKLLSLGETSSQIVQPLADPYRNRIAKSIRSIFEGQLIRPGPNAGHQIMRVLKETGALSLAADEYLGGELLAPSFGGPLRLDGNLGRAVRLAKLTKALICPFYCERLRGATFVLHCLPPAELDFSLRGDEFLRQGVQTLDNLITPIIVANIDQWLMLDNFKVPAGARVKPPAAPTRP